MDKIKQEIIEKRPFSGFIAFVREKGVIGLAVGLAIGTQATDLVKNIVGSTITPIINLIVGPKGISGMVWHVHIGDRSADFTFGTLLDALVRFLAVAFVIYLAVKVIGLEKIDKKPDDKKPEEKNQKIEPEHISTKKIPHKKTTTQKSSSKNSK
jgi:large conductance mechanosensitive channel